MEYMGMVRASRHELDGQGNKVAVVDDEVVCTWSCYCQGDNGKAINEHRVFPVEQLPAVEA